MARVLHIEDDPHSRRLVEKILVSAGHEVIETDNGLEGIRLASEVQPDLVLVDINVPDLDGYEVTLRLRSMSALKGVPIVAITAEGDRATSLAVGADGFIGKPIQARKFAATIKRFLGGHREEAAASKSDQEQVLRERSQRIVERLERRVRELQAANARLEEMARLRREFLQNVSHELATPMTPVVGYLRLLLGEELGELTPLQRKCIESIQRSTTRLRNVVETLLDVSALEAGRMHYYDRDYDLSEVIRQAAERVQVEGDTSRVRLVVEDLPELPARGDPDKIQRAIVHVLDNAVKFTPRGGRVAIGCVVDEARDALEVQVLDEGPGIAPAERERILEPFVQVDGSATRAHGGVGLGLAFARRVAEAMGGGIRVESAPGSTVAGLQLGGTLVRLRLARRAPIRTTEG